LFKGHLGFKEYVSGEPTMRNSGMVNSSSNNNGYLLKCKNYLWGKKDK
jgi:hypothetical protein